jgi:hypothetical protein
MSCLRKTKYGFLLLTNLHVRIFVSSQKKMVSLKVVHRLKICQYTQFFGPTLTGAIVVPTSEVLLTSAILELLKLVIRNHGVDVIFSAMTSVLNFIKFS